MISHTHIFVMSIHILFLIIQWEGIPNITSITFTSPKSFPVEMGYVLIRADPKSGYMYNNFEPSVSRFWKCLRTSMTIQKKI